MGPVTGGMPVRVLETHLQSSEPQADYGQGVHIYMGVCNWGCSTGVGLDPLQFQASQLKPQCIDTLP
jgi:hypothetical protein